MKYSFKTAEFLISCAEPKQFPKLLDSRGKPLPEIVLVGRSNVGKSSLINHLLQIKGLAKVSSMPGKTQLINFFKIDRSLVLVDLPGYGYAKAPKELQMKWNEGIQSYFEDRPHINLILLLLDIRRDPSPDDIRLVEWALFNQKELLLIFTKTDKLTASECKKNSATILSQLKFGNLSHVFYTVKELGSRDSLIKQINSKIS